MFGPLVLNGEELDIQTKKIPVKELEDILFFDCDGYWFKNQFKMERNKLFFQRLFDDINFDDLWFCDSMQKVYIYNEIENEWKMESKYNDTNLGLLLRHYLSLGWNLDKYDGNYMLKQVFSKKFKNMIDDENELITNVNDFEYYQKYFEYYVNGKGLKGRIEGPINDLEIQNIANVLVSPYSNPSELSFQNLTPKQLSLIKCSLNLRNANV